MALIGDNQISQISKKGADWLCDRQGKTIISPRSNEKDCIVKKSQIIALRFPIVMQLAYMDRPYKHVLHY